MSFVCPLPPEKVLVRPEYLYDFDPEHDDDELIEGVWVSVKSIRGQAFRFETYLPEFGALYDKLPISAFYWRRFGRFVLCKALGLPRPGRDGLREGTRSVRSLCYA